VDKAKEATNIRWPVHKGGNAWQHITDFLEKNGKQTLQDSQPLQRVSKKWKEAMEALQIDMYSECLHVVRMNAKGLAARMLITAILSANR